MSQPKPPIIVVDRGGIDLAIYDSVNAVERHLEAIDVRNDEYIAYDADGNRLRLEAKANRVFLRCDEVGSSHASELANSLRAFLRSTGTPVTDSDSASDLSKLIELCRQALL